MKRGIAVLLTAALLCLLAACHVREIQPSASSPSTPADESLVTLVVKPSQLSGQETAGPVDPAIPADTANDSTADGLPYVAVGEVVASYDDGALYKVRAEQNGVARYGIVDREGSVILPAIYLWIGVIDTDRLVATAGDAPALEYSRAWIFDAAGNVISAGEYNSIDYFQREDGTLTPYGVAFKNEGFYLVDRDGKTLDGRVWEWLSFENETTLTGICQGETLVLDAADF